MIDFNDVDQQGRTPLYDACYKGHFEVDTHYRKSAFQTNGYYFNSSQQFNIFGAKTIAP